MNYPIQMTIGVADEINHMPLTYWIYGEGVSFENDYTRKDLILTKAILLDLADAIEKKLASMVN